MYLMLYVEGGHKGWKVSFIRDELQEWADRNLNTLDGNDDYHIMDFTRNDLRRDLSVYCVKGNIANDNLFCGDDGNKEYTVGSDGKYYVCVPSGKSYIESKVEETEPLTEDFKNNHDISVILERADKEFCIWDAVMGLPLDLLRNILCYALGNDEDLSLRLMREERIPNAYGYCWWIDGWDEKHIISLISYLRFTRTLCTGVRLLYDELKRRNM